MSDTLDIKNYTLKGQGLKGLRLLQGIPMRIIAKDLNVSIITYQRYERDPFCMQLGMFMLIAQYYQITPEQLLEFITPLRGLNNETGDQIQSHF